MSSINEEYVKDFKGTILGIIRTESNGDQAAIDYTTRRILGWYRKGPDHTTTFDGRIVSRGNTVIAFIYTPNR